MDGWVSDYFLELFTTFVGYIVGEKNIVVMLLDLV
jgi:hypothetical protein